jgi:hypothetical protein
MALVQLDAPPAWFQQQQQQDHMTAAEARAFAGTDGEPTLCRPGRFVAAAAPAVAMYLAPRLHRTHPAVLKTACCWCCPAGKVLLLSNPVSAGYTQNPISVYYCYNTADKLAVAIAEVRRSLRILLKRHAQGQQDSARLIEQQYACFGPAACCQSFAASHKEVGWKNGCHSMTPCLCFACVCAR